MHASPQQLSHALDRLFDAVSLSLRRAPLFTAVSGGADSLSLAHIAQQYADRHGLAHEALVVNHNIRPEAHNEALAVMAELARHNIRAELLAIDIKAPDSA
ncbi:MAG: ATP-binding protein, partial [Candidatus Puniceispirillaceae bacterium]